MEGIFALLITTKAAERSGLSLRLVLSPMNSITDLTNTPVRSRVASTSLRARSASISRMAPTSPSTFLTLSSSAPDSTLSATSPLAERCRAFETDSRNEQGRHVLLGKLAPRMQLHKHVRLARHQHLVAAGGVELVTQHQAERQHHVLLHRAMLLRPRVITAVSRVEHDDGLEGTLGAYLGRYRGPRNGRLQAHGAEAEGAGLHGRPLGFGLCIGERLHRHDLQHELQPLAVLGLLDRRPVHNHWPSD